MKRSLMQVYVKGSKEAAECYKEAFGVRELRNVAVDKDGSYIHGELDVEGVIIALSEAENRTWGNNMEFCLHYDDNSEEKIDKAFKVLSAGGTVINEPSPNFYSTYMTSFIDKFGVCWCLFI